jgi:hypothetical protein
MKSIENDEQILNFVVVLRVLGRKSFKRRLERVSRTEISTSEDILAPRMRIVLQMWQAGFPEPWWEDGK